MANEVPIKKLILVPAVITLAITLLRLTGELLHWSPMLFNREAGGGGALVGIAWLVPVFGAYFGWVLARAGQRPAGTGAAIGLALAGFAICRPPASWRRARPAADRASRPSRCSSSVAIVGAVVAYRAWPDLGRTLFAYGLAARIPVILVMLVAMLGNWGTHYDVAPPGFPAMGTLAKWVAIGVVPQLTIWIWFTIAVGAIAGVIAAAIAGRSAPDDVTPR